MGRAAGGCQRAVRPAQRAGHPRRALPHCHRRTALAPHAAPRRRRRMVGGRAPARARGRVRGRRRGPRTNPRAAAGPVCRLRALAAGRTCGSAPVRAGSLLAPAAHGRPPGERTPDEAVAAGGRRWPSRRTGAGARECRACRSARRAGAPRASDTVHAVLRRVPAAGCALWRSGGRDRRHADLESRRVRPGRAHGALPQHDRPARRLLRQSIVPRTAQARAQSGPRRLRPCVAAV